MTEDWRDLFHKGWYHLADLPYEEKE